MLKNRIIEESKSAYSSPVLMIEKKDGIINGVKVKGGIRFCIDYRKLNAITKMDKFPLPLIQEKKSG